MVSAKTILKRVLFTNDDAALRYQHHSFSQEGEDLILLRFFESMHNGRYVDVGAHHPFRFSNTHLLYQRGWRGINIDPLPNSMKLFRKYRPEDTNLEIGISSAPGTMPYHMFNEPALNCFDKALAESRIGGQYDFRLEEVREVPVMPLKQILEEHQGSDVRIDLLSIDAEGHDLVVVQSNDWTRFRPRMVVIEEEAGVATNEPGNGPVSIFLREIGYRLCAMTKNSLFYEDARATT